MIEAGVLAVVGKGTVTCAKVVLYGALLSVGFWAGRKLTNQADLWLVLWDKKMIKAGGLDGFVVKTSQPVAPN